MEKHFNFQDTLNDDNSDRRRTEGSVRENVMFSQAAVRFLVGQPWRNKHGKASPLAWFALRGAQGNQSLGRHKWVPESNHQGWPVGDFGPGLAPMSRKI